MSAEEEEDEEEELVALCDSAEDWREEGEDDEEVVVVAVLCCTAGDFVFKDSLDATESLCKFFWKKSKMVAELLQSSHSLFLDG